MEKMKLWCLFSLLIALAGRSTSTSNKQPNVVFFVTDDWGFNDVGYNGNTDTLTPFIDYLATTESLIISQHYVQPLCTPSRAALLTGRYPMRYGLHDGTITVASPFALTQYEHLLSSEFANQGYSTHIVGKWHLGHMTDDYTPLQRDFDTFVGFYGGAIGYFDSTSKHNGMTGYDFHKNSDQYTPDSDGYDYSMYAYHDRVLDILDDITNAAQDDDDNDKPFFLYVGWQGSHTPSDAPDEYKDMYESAEDDDLQKDEQRVAFQAQTTLTDVLFESIVQSLKSHDIWDNTLLIFTSDNGATQGIGDNSPLRGSKSTLWEGGIRVPAFVTGGILPPTQRGEIMKDYAMHITDWYPTVLGAAGLDTMSPNLLDGKNMWPVLSGNADNDLTDDEKNAIGSEREILINVDSNDCGNEICGALIYGGKWKVVITDNQFVDAEAANGATSCFWERTFELDTSNDVLGCNGIPDEVSTDTCICTNTVCLFDLENDPCEYFDVSGQYDDMTQTLYKKLALYYDQQTELLFDYFEDVDDDIINPDNFGGYWEPFYDCETYTIDNIDFEKMLESNYKFLPDVSSPQSEKSAIPIISEQERRDEKGFEEAQNVGAPMEPLMGGHEAEEQQQKKDGERRGSTSGIPHTGVSWIDNHVILICAIAFVIIFGSIIACCFGTGLHRYYAEVRGKEGIILTEFLREKREMERYNENSPLMRNDERVVL